MSRLSLYKNGESLLDKKSFVLAAADYDDLIAILNQPPKPNEELRKLFSKKPIWEK